MDDIRIDTEQRWQELMERWEGRSTDDPRPNISTHLAVLIRCAAERELRRLVPYTSHQYFSVSRKPYPDFDPLPMIEPLEDGTYALTTFGSGRVRLASGTAPAVLDVLEKAVRGLAPEFVARRTDPLGVPLDGD